ncbi:ABC transporter permease [Salinifilum ghardaiensis]
MTGHTARLAFRRGFVELRHTFTSGQDLWGYLFPPVVFLIVMSTQSDSTVEGTGFSLAAMTLPSVLGMTVVFTGMVNATQALTVDREDGTLLRAKATPHGMVTYLAGKIVMLGGITAVSLLILLLPGAVFFDGLELASLSSWATFLWVAALGLVATLPIGAVFGSLFSNPRQMGFIMVPIMGLVVISGIFFPITVFPTWVQVIAQVFPLYWTGLGMRSALLPDQMAVAEIGESWRHLETLGVLGTWAVVGMLVAPVVLRRMASRESGSTVAARKEKALNQPI